MDPKKICVLQIVPSLVAGGGEHVGAYIAWHLNRDEFTSHVLSLWGPLGTPMERHLAEAGVPVHFLEKRRGLDMRVFRDIDRTIADLRPDVVHTHLSGLRYSLISIMRRKKILWLHTIHSIAQKEAPFPISLVHRLAFLLGVRPVAIADYVAETVRAVYKRPPAHVVPNGILVKRFREPILGREAWRRAEGFGPDELLFTCVARIEEVKNHEMLVEAFARATEGRPGIKLLLAGRITERAEGLKKKIEALGIADQVVFLDIRDDIPELLGASDGFVLSSRWEGHPLCVMEAMASSLPVICTLVGGVPELIDHGRTGLLAPPEDPDAFSHALKMLVDDAGLRRRLGEAAGAEAQQRFSIHGMVDAYERIYRRAGAPV